MMNKNHCNYITSHHNNALISFDSISIIKTVTVIQNIIGYLLKKFK